MVQRLEGSQKISLNLHDIIVSLGILALNKHFELNIVTGKDIVYIQSLVDAIPELKDMEELKILLRSQLDSTNKIIDYIREKNTPKEEPREVAVSSQSVTEKKKRGRKKKKVE